ncbi:hypothetical protein J6590_010226 [Homalodisca vitripennis]|nr:hypothetical protein J6590_010226 [Homalodisca vitripennis]
MINRGVYKGHEYPDDVLLVAKISRKKRTVKVRDLLDVKSYLGNTRTFMLGWQLAPFLGEHPSDTISKLVRIFCNANIAIIASKSENVPSTAEYSLSILDGHTAGDGCPGSGTEKSCDAVGAVTLSYGARPDFSHSLITAPPTPSRSVL